MGAIALSGAFAREEERAGGEAQQGDGGGFGDGGDDVVEFVAGLGAAGLLDEERVGAGGKRRGETDRTGGDGVGVAHQRQDVYPH